MTKKIRGKNAMRNKILTLMATVSTVSLLLKTFHVEERREERNTSEQSWLCEATSHTYMYM